MLSEAKKDGKVIGVIGHTGLIGSYINSKVNTDYVFNSTNIDSLFLNNFSVVYCAAPSGNRLDANLNSGNDLSNVNSIIKNLNKTTIDHLVLISTVDTIHYPDTAYGKNRLILEEFVKQKFSNYSIIRLPTLIDKKISKNLLFDLKHRKYLSSINLLQTCHWYYLPNLYSDISLVVSNNINEINLVSEPILNEEVVDYFFPDLEKVDSNFKEVKSYNLTCEHAFLFNGIRYRDSKEQIFEYMKQYVQS